MTLAAAAMPRNAASSTLSGSPTKVTTLRLVSAPESTSMSFTPDTDSMASVIWRILARSRPSEKLGTHSTTRWFMLSSLLIGSDDAADRDQHGLAFGWVIQVPTLRSVKAAPRLGVA